ncbi:hypothetical protein ACFL1T_02545 [Chlamydiota bacterium]
MNSNSLFKTLFGITKKDVKKTCILIPLIPKRSLEKFGIKSLVKGKLYSAASTEQFTIIKTGIGPALAGDAVLYLGETPCENIILFGSCGLVEKEATLDIGSLVIPHTCYSFESFSDMLSNKNSTIEGIYPNKELYNALKDSADQQKITEVRCATCGSLKLEENYLPLLQDLEVDIVDMECSAVFSAAKSINKKVAALFYINDIIMTKPFHLEKSKEDQQKLTSGIHSGIKILLGSALES